jgi:hypothetical protein
MTSPALVAPFTGAWIETHFATWRLLTMKVAPFTGAWIEASYQVSRPRDPRKMKR